MTISTPAPMDPPRISSSTHTLTPLTAEIRFCSQRPCVSRFRFRNYLSRLAITYNIQHIAYSILRLYSCLFLGDVLPLFVFQDVLCCICASGLGRSIFAGGGFQDDTVFSSFPHFRFPAVFPSFCFLFFLFSFFCSQVRSLEDKHRRRSAELQQAYAEDLGQGLLKASHENRLRISTLTIPPSQPNFMHD